MQNLTVNWEDYQSLMFNLVIEWLKELAITDVSLETLPGIMKGKSLILPHSTWVYCGLSGSSIPDNITIDYHNKIACLVPFGTGESYLKDYYLKLNLDETVESLNNVVHYGKLESLCGRIPPSADVEVNQTQSKPKYLTEKISDVTCPHCGLEVIVRVKTDIKLPH